MAGYSGIAEGPGYAPPRRAPSELGRQSRRAVAGRLRWPPGALEACERLEAAYPGWAVAWFPEWRRPEPGFDRDAGFYAWFRGEDPGWMSPSHGYQRRFEAYATDPARLEQEIWTWTFLIHSVAVVLHRRERAHRRPIVSWRYDYGSYVPT